MNKDIQNMIALIGDHVKYGAGTRVWFPTSAEMGQGVVLDWRVIAGAGQIEYFVTFSPGMYYWLNEHELATEKPIEI